jgi:hypothetical protein
LELFGVGMAWFPVVLGLEPNMTAAIASIMVLGIAVGRWVWPLQ